MSCSAFVCHPSRCGHDLKWLSHVIGTLPGVIPLIEFLVVLGVDIDVHQKNPSAFVSHRSVLSIVHRCHRAATSRLHPPGRLKPGQDEHTLGSPLCTSCNATRPPGDHWGAGSVPQSLS